jgi:DNA-binding winged helix-turn-helix (wHTH) protein/tetratricopeptide (TPR) repeat protein/TolB-like protein
MTVVPTAAEKRHYQFDQFRVDPFRRLLLRDGEVVPVTPKVFSILLVLLEKRGEVVDKKDLLEQVWPDTVVTEANLTQNVSSLRKALGERASERRYVVTMPGRGYSFVGDVVEVPVETSAPEPASPVPSAAESEAVSALSSPDPIPAEEGEPEPAPGDSTAPVSPPRILPAPVPPARERPRLLATVLGVLILIAVVISVLYFAQAPGRASAAAEEARLAPSSSRRPSVAVLGFKNLTGAPDVRWLAPALAEMLTTELSAGGKVRVVSGENVARVRQSLSLPYTDSLDQESLARLSQQLSSDRVVVGSYLALEVNGGRRVRLDLRVLQLPSGTPIGSMTELGTEAELFDLVARSGVRLRRILGLAEPSPEQARAVQAMHPATPDAARLYAEGLARLRFWDFPAARQHLEQAAMADPSSAAIHTALSKTWSELGYDARAIEAARRALELSGPLSREERLAIEARLYEVSRQWSRAGEIYRSLWTFFPDDLDYGLQLAICLGYAGRSQEALQAIAALRRLPSPQGDDSRLDLAEARVAMRRSDSATTRRAAESAIAKGRVSGEDLVVAHALLLRGGALMIEGNAQASLPSFKEALELNERAGNRWGVAMALAYTGLSLHRLGDLEGAEKVYLEALDIAQKLGSASGIAAQNGNLGRLYLDRGELERALGYLEKSRTQFSEVEDPLLKSRVLYHIGLILSTRGDLDSSTERFQEVLDTSRRIGSRFDEARALTELGTVLARRGRLGEARRHADNAVQLLSEERHPGYAAMALAASADVHARLGGLDVARQRFDRALELERKIGDRIGIARVLGARARLALREGNLPRARREAEEQLRLARETGARAAETEALRVLGGVDLAAGELARARTSLSMALQVGTAAGEELETAVVRLEMARVDLAADRPADAVRLAREVVAWAGPRGALGLETEGLATLSEALLRQGDLAGARTAAGRARSKAEGGEDRELRVAIAAALGRSDAAGGNSAGALRALRQTAAEAARLGFIPAGLEVRLALGEIAFRQGDATTARGALEAVQRDARARGLERIARVAALWNLQLSGRIQG